MEDLPLGRIAALVPEFAVKDLLGLFQQERRNGVPVPFQGLDDYSKFLFQNGLSKIILAISLIFIFQICVFECPSNVHNALFGSSKN